MRRTFIAAAAAATLALGAPAAMAGPPSVDGSIVDTAIAVNAQTGEFDELIAAVTAADLADTLDTKRRFTVFAPTDQAFADLAAALGVTDANGNGLVADDLVGALGIETVTDVLLYHVSPGQKYAEDVVSSDSVNTLLKGERIPVEDDGTLLDEANPVALDIQTSNGVIHIIDAVMLPSFIG